MSVSNVSPQHINRTEEQQSIVHSALNRESNPILIVRAGAGTGKTFTLNDVAQQLKPRNERILYLVFNSKNCVEARSKFRGLADVYTVNGFAFQQMKVRELGRSVTNNIYPKQIAQILGLHNKVCGIHAFQAAKLIRQTLSAFCISADPKVMPYHLAVSVARGKNQDLAAALVRYTQSLFDTLRPGASTQHPVTHDIYTKAFQLEGCPGINTFDLVMIDEAQDSNALTISILRKAVTLLMVGDDHQTIYTFRGSKNAMQAFSGRELTLTQSFRFGAAIADIANSIVYQKRVKPLFPPLKGCQDIQSTIGPIKPGVNHTRLYRSNIQLVLDALYFADNNLPIYIVGDLKDLRSKIQSGWDLFLGNLSTQKHALLSQYRGWGDFEKSVQLSRDVELKQIYKVITDYNHRVPDIIDLLGKEWCPKKAKIILASGHRSKGLEFENVVISQDFDRSIDHSRGSETWDDEMNLMYVAVTRGRLVVDLKSEFVNQVAQRLGLA